MKKNIYLFILLILASIVILNACSNPLGNSGPTMAINKLDYDTTVGETIKVPVSVNDPDNDVVKVMIKPEKYQQFWNPEDGIFSWAPENKGNYSIKFVVTDGETVTEKTITVNVTGSTSPVVDGENAPHLDNIDNVTVLEGEHINIKPTATDDDGDKLSYSVSGDLVKQFDIPIGQFSWTPGATDAGVYFVTFKVSDGSNIDSQEVKITVNDNSQPVFANINKQIVTVGENVDFVVEVNDPNGDELTVTAKGDLSQYYDEKDGQFNWPTVVGDTGEYNITFEASDGVNTSTYNVPIVVQENNSAPILSNVNDKIVNTGESLSFPVNVEDPDGDQVTYYASGDLATYFNDGIFTWNDIPRDKYGDYNLHIAVDDGHSHVDEETIKIKVNAIPEFKTLSDKIVDEGDKIEFDVSANDPDNTTLLYTASGQLADYFDTQNHLFSWSTGPDDVGTYGITFIADDGLAKSKKQVSITVNNIPDCKILFSGSEINPATGPISFVAGRENSFIIEAFDSDDDNLNIEMIDFYQEAEHVNIDYHFYYDKNSNKGIFSWAPTSEDITNGDTYSILFKVSDNQGGSVLRSIALQVQ